MKEKDKKKEKRIMTEFRVFVTDEKGKVVRDTGTKECKSFVKQFLVYIVTDLSVHSRTCKDVNGEEFDMTPYHHSSYKYHKCGLISANAPAEDDNYGIQVGRNDTPPTNEDFRLQEKIDHGDESGQLEYDKMMFFDITESGGYMKFPFIRTFYNNSGATITVKEIGLVARVNFDNKYCLLLRDVLSPPIDVEHGKTLTVQYIIKTKA